MDYLPIFLKLTKAPCLVVGAGEVASRKIQALLRVDAAITVLAPEMGAEVCHLMDAHPLRYCQKAFEPEDIRGFSLVISATNDPAVNQDVADTCRARGILVNVVDCPRLCDFIFPAIVDRSPVIIAVSTGGRSPVLARLIRGRLESLLPSGYGQLAQLAEQFRERVKQTLKDARARRRFWEEALDGPPAELCLQGRDQEARIVLERRLQDALATPLRSGSPGSVSLVGAGPGDPDLLTLRAYQLLQKADVIVHDRLVSAEILRLGRADARRIDVGKARSRHTLPQDDINQLLVQLAREGLEVVRLKGGDPFVFGRGGEEIETLMAEAVPFQIVPGVTAATGCAAYAGIPLTHRDHAQSVAFVTGHGKDGAVPGVDWSRYVDAGQTLVIYMGLNAFPGIRDRLISAGMPQGMPAAIIQNGTLRDQKVVVGTLESLEARALEAGVTSPALIIVGTVVGLREQLEWFQGSS